MNQLCAKADALDHQVKERQNIEKIKKLISRSEGKPFFIEVFELLSECPSLNCLKGCELHNLFGGNRSWWDKINKLAPLTIESRKIIKLANSSGIIKVGLEAAITIACIKSGRAQEKVSRCAASSQYKKKQQVIDCVDEFREGIRTFRPPKGMDPSGFVPQEVIPLEEFFLTAKNPQEKVKPTEKQKKVHVKKAVHQKERRKVVPALEKKYIAKVGNNTPDKFKSESFIELKGLLKSFNSHYLDISIALIRCLEEKKIGKEELSRKIKMGPKKIKLLTSLKNLSLTAAEKIRRSFRFSDCPFFSLEAAAAIASLELEEDQIEVIQFCIIHKLKRNAEVEAKVSLVQQKNNS